MLFPSLASTTQSSDPQVQGRVSQKRYHLSFEIEDRPKRDDKHGSCWFPLFSNISIISGFPILRRPQSTPGLEISLAVLASLIRSREIVQCGRRIMMKGFDSLLLATMVTSTTVYGHLSVSGESGKRIGYFDDIHNQNSDPDPIQGNLPTLQTLQSARHIVGWCPDAEDMCGKFYF